VDRSAFRRVVVAGLVVLAPVGCVRPDPPPPDSRIAVHTLPPLPGHRHAQANDINERGEAVGWSLDAQGLSSRAVLWRDGRVVALRPSSPNGSMAWKVNERSQVALTETGPGLTTGAYLWTAGQVTNLTGEARYAVPLDLNDAGQVLVKRSWSGLATPAPTYRYDVWSDGVFTPLAVDAGSATFGTLRLLDDGSVVGTRGDVPFRWRDGTFTDLAASGRVVDANARGEVLGTTGTGAATTTVIWHDGMTTTISAPDGGLVFPADLSEDGRVAGFVARDDGNHGFVWHDGVLTDLGPGRTAAAVNEQGVIVGSLSDPGGGRDHAVVWIDGRAVDLGTVTYVHDLNGHGQLVGTMGDDARPDNGIQGDATLWSVIDG
jgi:probable HAF family extracellular repeat protein